MRLTYLLLVITVLLGFSCSSDDAPPVKPTEEEEEEEIVLHLADKEATAETRALYAQLWAMQSAGVMFGHHDDLIYGREWIGEQGGSDVREVCGDYPAVFSVDFAEIMDDRKVGSTLNDDRKRTILEARSRGEVIIANCHLSNPLTGGDSWDNSDNTVVRKILQEGSPVNIRFRSWLDNLAAFVHDLKDKDGKLIPLIFRPFHEHTQTWSWWGRSCTTKDEFVALWRFTVNYLKDEKDVHNLIYAISPQLDAAGTVNNLLFRWPGDDYVDFIGMDSYHGTNTEALITNIKNLEKLSQEKKKPCGVTETGIEGIRKNNGDPYKDYWTREILTPIIGKQISMIVMWRNKYDPAHEGHHFYGPFAGHSSSADFVKFYESPYTLFSRDLPDMYLPAEGVTVGDKAQ